MRAWLAVVVIGCGGSTPSSTSPPAVTDPQVAVGSASPSPVATAPVGTAPATTTTTTAPKKLLPCELGVPAAACKVADGLRVCKPTDTDRVGEWRFAIAAPSFAESEDISTSTLQSLWKREGAIETSRRSAARRSAAPGLSIVLTATIETQAALTGQFGPGK